MRGNLSPTCVLALIIGLPLLLGACSEMKLASHAIKGATQPSQDGSTGGYKIGNPYQIQGVWYYPAEDYEYDETGIASWYGPNFHGKSTANGESFDQNAITGAHRTLPMPCLVRVTNLENGRSLVIRVNDRGPFAHGRIIDLSRRSAQLLGMEATGTARVRVQIMAEESRAIALQAKGGTIAPQPAAAPRESVVAETLPVPGSREKARPVTAPPPPPERTLAAPVPATPTGQVEMAVVKSTRVYLQAGAFSQFDNANRTVAALSPVGKAWITQVQTGRGTFFRVRMGPIETVADADTLLEKVISNGYPEAKIVVD